MKTFLLASQSPRRKELLERAGFKIHTFSVKVSEFLDKNLILDDAIQAIARQKAMAAVEQIKHLKSQDILILASDTLVVLEKEILGKPQDEGQAFQFLRRLSGQTHEVKTAICFFDLKTQKLISEVESSFVTFRNLSVNEIREYIKTGEPMDKAGAYGIQGLGGNFIQSLQGNLDNVMGLPVERVKRILRENHWWNEIEKQSS